MDPSRPFSSRFVLFPPAPKLTLIARCPSSSCCQSIHSWPRGSRERESWSLVWAKYIALTVEACRKGHAAKACTKATCLIVRHTQACTRTREREGECCCSRRVTPVNSLLTRHKKKLHARYWKKQWADRGACALLSTAKIKSLLAPSLPQNQ